jgi:hypothetical protein
VSGTVAVVVATGLHTLCGLGVLALLAAARSPGELVRRSPVAPLAGMAWVGILAATAAAAGVEVGVAGLLLVTAVTCIAGAVRLGLGTQSSASESRHRAGGRLELVLAGVALAVLAVVVGFGLATYSVKPLVEYDGWAIWGMKAKAIAWVDADADVLASDAYARLHLEYPPLLPALNALPIDAAEAFDSNMLVLSCVVVGVVGLLAIWGLLWDRVRPALLLPFLAAIAAMPAFFFQLGSGYADVPVAMFVAAGAGAAARWLLNERGSWLALATLFLGASALTKNEGLLSAVAVLVPLFVVARGRRRIVAVAGAVVALVYAPWRAYIAVHDLGSPAYDLSSSFDPGWVVPRLRRVPEAVLGVLERAGDPRELGLLLLVGAACTTLTLLLGERRLGLFAAGFTLLSLGGLSWIYVISPMEVSSFLDSSADRVVISAVVGLATLSPLLIEECSRTLAAPDESSADAGSLSPVGKPSPVLGRRSPSQ